MLSRRAVNSQGRHDAESEGRELPLSIQCYAMKKSCAPSSGHPSPGRLPLQGVLLSEVAQIPAQIGNLEVHKPQGQQTWCILTGLIAPTCLSCLLVCHEGVSSLSFSVNKSRITISVSLGYDTLLQVTNYHEVNTMRQNFISNHCSLGFFIVCLNGGLFPFAHWFISLFSFYWISFPLQCHQNNSPSQLHCIVYADNLFIDLKSHRLHCIYLDFGLFPNSCDWQNPTCVNLLSIKVHPWNHCSPRFEWNYLAFQPLWRN